MGFWTYIMMPKIDPRQIAQMMKRMGIQQQEIDATEVIIKCPDKDIIITEPNVSKINAMGQESFQISGNVSEREKEAEITEDDVKTVAEQANVDEEKAREALKNSKGDIAKAIIELQEN